MKASNRPAADEFSMGFVLEIDYEVPPEFITVQQRHGRRWSAIALGAEDSLETGWRDTPYIHMMKPTTPETFRFDWDQPILSTGSL